MRAVDAERAAPVDLARHPHRVDDPQHGPMPANTSAVAFTPPTTCTTMREDRGIPPAPPSRSALRIMSAIIHGSAAHGRRITEMRAA